MRALITGITGFVGSHLAEHLVQQGDHVAGISRSGRAPRDWTVADQVQIYRGDVRDAGFLGKVLREVQPEVIYHVAAQSSVPASFREPEETWQLNLEATRQLYELLRQLPEGQRPRVVFASTGSIYQATDVPKPLDEGAVLAPASPYAASKAAADLLSFQVAANYGLHVIRLRCFNQLGPRQRLGFVAADAAYQIVLAERGERPPEIRVGDRRPVRDFCDVRDVVRAFRLAALYGAPGEVFNVGSGVGRSIGELLDQLVALAARKVRVVSDPSLHRRADPTALVADSTKFRSLTGWAPSIPFSESLRDVLEDWRQRVAVD